MDYTPAYRVAEEAPEGELDFQVPAASPSREGAAVFPERTCVQGFPLSRLGWVCAIFAVFHDVFGAFTNVDVWYRHCRSTGLACRKFLEHTAPASSGVAVRSTVPARCRSAMSCRFAHLLPNRVTVGNLGEICDIECCSNFTHSGASVIQFGASCSDLA